MPAQSCLEVVSRLRTLRFFFFFARRREDEIGGVAVLLVPPESEDELECEDELLSSEELSITFCLFLLCFFLDLSVFNFSSSCCYFLLLLTFAAEGLGLFVTVLQKDLNLP